LVLCFMSSCHLSFPWTFSSVSSTQRVILSTAKKKRGKKIDFKIANTFLVTKSVHIHCEKKSEN
jgi:hypothetical protein